MAYISDLNERENALKYFGIIVSEQIICIFIHLSLVLTNLYINILIKPLKSFSFLKKSKPRFRRASPLEYLYTKLRQAKS